MTDEKALLKVKNLNAYFGKFQALHNISLEVFDHEVVSLIGPSGCGKSTFTRCLNRLHEEVRGAYSEGEVWIGDQNIYAHDADPVVIRRQVGMVFQKPNPFPGLSIFENVAIGLKLAGVTKKSILTEAVERSLKKAALWEEVKDSLKASGASLSGGQQQRLCLARTLAVDPPVVLMDEPTSALDPISTSKIEDLILELKSERTIIIVTHNIQQASRIADKTAFFMMGELTEFGPTSRLFTNPQNTKTEQYITGRFG